MLEIGSSNPVTVQYMMDGSKVSKCNNVVQIFFLTFNSGSMQMFENAASFVSVTSAVSSSVNRNRCYDLNRPWFQHHILFRAHNATNSSS